MCCLDNLRDNAKKKKRKKSEKNRRINLNNMEVMKAMVMSSNLKTLRSLPPAMLESNYLHIFIDTYIHRCLKYTDRFVQKFEKFPGNGARWGNRSLGQQTEGTPNTTKVAN